MQMQMQMGEKHCRKTSDRYSGGSIFQCAGAVLSYLNPTELASTAASCKTLYQFSKLIIAERISDASRGFENVPIPFLNPIVGDSQPYSYFLYTPTQVLPIKSDFRQPWGTDDETGRSTESRQPYPFLFLVEDACGCECGSECDCCSNCPCMECGPSCRCDSRCGNRITQEGVSVKLKTVKDERKGWGLYAAELIPKGKFVCEYAGELLSTTEARKRQQKYDELAFNGQLAPALLVVKEHLPSGNTCIRINIDATKMGNVARFINHSCDGGNLDTEIVRSSGALLPRVCFFSSRDIQENEELCFSYGSIRLKPNGQQCFCGSSSCSGFLPSEYT